MGVSGYNNTSEPNCDKLLPIIAIIVKAVLFKTCWFLDYRIILEIEQTKILNL